MKNKILITALVLIVAGTIAWFLSQDKNGKIANTNIKTTVISAKKPINFDNVEMSIYRSSLEYEITYPKVWVSDLAPKGTGPDLEYYAIYPKEIDYGPPPVIRILVNEKPLLDLLSELKIGVENLDKISINGFKGYLWPQTDHPSTNYFFEANGFTYRVIYWYSPEYGISQEEALWVLSTFKITK